MGASSAVLKSWWLWSEEVLSSAIAKPELGTVDTEARVTAGMKQPLDRLWK